MNKQITYLLFICLFNINGQISAQSMAESIVTLDFQEIIEITVADEKVDLEMTHFNHFLSGNSVELVDHIVVTSFPKTGDGYVVFVEASDAKFSNSNIPVNTVLVEAVGKNISGAAILNKDEVLLWSSGKADIMQGYDIKYSIPADQTSSYLNQVAGEYSTTVIYTIISR